jgi:hypothetical protein
MARYIDCEKCYHRNVCQGDTDKWNYYGECPHYINTADVVPKSEVETLKSIITRKEDEAYERGYAEGKADVVITNYAKEVKEYAREIFEEIEYSMSLFEDDDDDYILKKCEFEFFMRELKKKYTEG